MTHRVLVGPPARREVAVTAPFVSLAHSQSADCVLGLQTEVNEWRQGLRQQEALGLTEFHAPKTLRLAPRRAPYP